MGSLPNLHELSKQQPVGSPPVLPRLSPNPCCAAGGVGRRGGRAQQRRLQQTNSLCTGNFYGVIDQQADMQINEVSVRYYVHGDEPNVVT